MADYYPPSSRFGIYGANVYQGIVGGIPSRAGGTQIDVTGYGWSAENTAAENSTALAAALDASAAGDVIHLPAGTFAFNGITLQTSRNNRTIRGAGAGTGGTVLVVPNGIQAFRIGYDANTGNEFNRSSQITAMTRGSQDVTLSSSTAVYAGYRQMVRVMLRNEQATPVAFTNFRSDYVRGFDAVITGQSGTTLTFSQPLAYGFADALAAGNATVEELFQLNFLTSGIGIEDIYFDCSAHTTGSPTYAAVISYSEGCWLKNVKIVTGGQFALAMSDVVNCEVTYSQLIGDSAGGPGRGGVILDHATNCLIEDNYIKGDPALYNWGNNFNNVYGYNYFDGTVNANHKPWESHNLYEGNTWPFLQSDGFYGGSSEDTLFRNWMRANLLASLKRFTRNYNCVGNLVGVVGVSTGTDYTEHWGDPSMGNEVYLGEAQPSLGDWWADWDTATGRPVEFQLQLTTRSTDYQGVATILDPSEADALEASLSANMGYPRTRNVFGNQFVVFGARSGNTWPISSQGGDASGFALPALNTIDTAIAGAGGFQERDLDVLGTAIRKANWYVVHGNAIRSGEELDSGETLPASYYRTAKPDFFGSLAWPAYDPLAPGTPDAERIPAGYRFINGEDPGGEPATPPANPTRRSYGRSLMALRSFAN